MKNPVILATMIILSSCASAHSLSRKDIARAATFTYSAGNQSLPPQYAWLSEIVVSRDSVSFYDERGGKESSCSLKITPEQYKEFTDAVALNKYVSRNSGAHYKPGATIRSFYVHDSEGSFIFGGESEISSMNGLDFPFSIFKKPAGED